jgi:hypothetical protein
MLMQDVVYRRAAAHQAEDLQRLADRADREGVIIYVERVVGRHDATSGRDPTRLYRVSPSACDCPGFTTWGRCGHAALLASQLSWIPDPTDAGPPAPVAVVLLPAERGDELARRRERAELARSRLAERAADPGAADRAHAAANAARARRMASGLSVVRG